MPVTIRRVWRSTAAQEAETKKAPRLAGLGALETDSPSPRVTVGKMGETPSGVNGEAPSPERRRSPRSGPNRTESTMLFPDMRRAIEAAPRLALPELARALWKAHAAGSLVDDDAQALAELIEARKAIPISRETKRRTGSRARSAASVERRRCWSASGWMPPVLQARFTQGEAAALRGDRPGGAQARRVSAADRPHRRGRRGQPHDRQRTPCARLVRSASSPSRNDVSPSGATPPTWFASFPRSGRPGCASGPAKRAPPATRRRHRGRGRNCDHHDQQDSYNRERERSALMEDKGNRGKTLPDAAGRGFMSAR